MKEVKEFLIHLKKYQNNLESTKGSDFFFYYIQLLYYKCHKMSLNCGGSYIDSHEWIKSKKATIFFLNKKEMFMLSIRCNSRV